MMGDHVIIETDSGRAEFDPLVGNLPLLHLNWHGRVLSPLHSAPWRDEPAAQSDPGIHPVERRLAGDFFCAPFAGAADPAVPPHGLGANTGWSLQDSAPGRAVLRLDRRISGATVQAVLELAPDAPLLIQTHVIEGGDGILPVAHHPMTRLRGAGRLGTSPKRAAITPAQPLEPGGRSHLAYPARSTDLTAFPAASGGSLDLTRLPISDRHEDFVTLIEAAPQGLGWTAILREAEDDIVFILKDAAVLPVTMLWFSNGGRDYAPWNGRHIGVLGIEDGCAPGIEGEAAAARPNAISAEGVATGLALAPGRRHVIRHAIGAVPRPTGWTGVTSITLQGGVLTLTGDDGVSLRLPFPADFLNGDA